MPFPTILALDTSAAHCAAAVLAQDAMQQSATEAMAKGQAERILVLCEEILARSGLGYDDLTAIGVGIGPGNFTGIRISVSAARGLALGLGIPAIPVSSFEMLRDPFAVEANAAELVIVEAPRGAAYAQPFRYGHPTDKPEIIDPMSPPEHLCRADLKVTGHLAEKVACALGAIANPTTSAEDPAARIARIAAWKLAQGHDITQRPAPLYVRAPDAAPARDKPPVILA
ncbi:tRNA (adenosine(37)-N6)-threonylcarbamoyltransferase complex dimerization subunit type 1 TsaB [Sulfitobacter sp. F26204]|uniref:tRNA (adenosine(37)-N6)-threonylcarbamoyltransferase complex dimerization subunit type 1 TsaB n=1 Tax=Sulfitobacter sp. F26204 TaxID=2996014 RepID=UPI00225E0FFA|nr:tRNA (adenosine(37)-N6)-threonylcarbamoyltransferase complex dimerization subunit type 1 TsaB [Sulfitobacter sp. F26204]MCX7561068.1 tRNA (adenosine(37)-N6)-threonylcarbamoyltransferase complex dimerization subunit type 1 TsaB [Sulfitobacter sp. F26204]